MLSYLFTCSEGDFAGLQIEDDPTPRLLSRYISDTGLYVTLMATYKSGVFPSSYEILFPEQEEEACKMVEIALHAYAKQKDMPVWIHENNIDDTFWLDILEFLNLYFYICISFSFA